MVYACLIMSCGMGIGSPSDTDHSWSRHSIRAGPRGVRIPELF
jgi:hypothetical protein